MSENSTQMSLFPGMEGSTSSLPVSPARTFQLQEIRQELKQIEVDSFSRLPGFPTRSTPIAELDRHLCWRTSQISLLETGGVGQEPYTGSWPAEGIVLNGKLWGQKMWEHLTGGLDGGQSVTWPTPDTQNHRDGTKVRKDNNLAEGGRHGVSLHHAVVQWPTPAANPPGWKNIEVVDKDGNYPTHINQRFYDKKTGRLVQKGLEQVVQWPTPRANSAMASTITPEVAWDQNRFPNLETEVGRKNWPTPTARDGKSGRGEQDRKYSELSPAIERQHLQGNLNADWVEALMGYPPGWTSLDDGETDPGRKESPE